MLLPVGAKNVSTNEIRVLALHSVPVENLTSINFQLWYQSDGDVIPLSLVDLATPADPYTEGGIISLGDGWYRLDLPDIFEPESYTVLIGGSIVGQSHVVLTAPINIIERVMGSEKIFIDADYPTENNLRVVTPDSSPVESVAIRWYLKEDWDAGRRGASYMRGESFTDVNGRWPGLFVSKGEIVLTFSKVGYYFKHRVVNVN